MHNLTVLYLDRNQLTTLPDWITTLTQLKRLTIHGNPGLAEDPDLLANLAARQIMIDPDDELD